jgi:hypothetical protein
MFIDYASPSSEISTFESTHLTVEEKWFIFGYKSGWFEFISAVRNEVNRSLSSDEMSSSNMLATNSTMAEHCEVERIVESEPFEIETTAWPVEDIRTIVLRSLHVNPAIESQLGNESDGIAFTLFLLCNCLILFIYIFIYLFIYIFKYRTICWLE